MTRAEIAAVYQIVNGTIRSPGKFEGEPVWAPHFYERANEGFGRVYYWKSIWIDISPEDRREFPELDPNATQVEVYERDDGFVCCTQLDEGGQPI